MQKLSEKISVDSCGLDSWFIGEDPDARTANVAKTKGVYLDHKAKQFQKDFFQKFNLILGVTKCIVEDLNLLASNKEEMKKIKLASIFSQKYPKKDIPDPYYSEKEDFDYLMDIAEDIAEGIINSLS